ncbi:uncharacterized protein LOC126967806 isoform X2 [Leptidea sinapis]|uniref:uncharacterized protein LOC126967806 isoform X2 n=1 Tax=Leptidea sinapis TaxID=189913 RepID=UPI00213A5A02|nr:uncharacterized protein LOC126967806 isoform X2 [Leptidea sinapis]XP_050668463.1 uncharacterized protein LOC126967806 isoform X2 [Leptidea sinapis]
MTEGSRKQYEKPMCVRVWLEVGHACEPRRSALGRSLALDWRVWVRGARGGDISAFVQKVVFNLHPPSAFFYPKRVLHEPPYEIQESGCASINIPIHVYLKYSNKPKKIRLRYSLHIDSNNKANSESKCVYYDFDSPEDQLFSALMKGGGEIIARASGSDSVGNKLVVLPSAEERKYLKMSKSKRYKFIAPIHCKHTAKQTRAFIVDEIVCQKCGETIDADLRKQLRTVKMTEDEIDRVSHLYLSYSSYEKSANALELPPFTNPIYSVPELPVSLRRDVSNSKIDYTVL